MTDLHNSIKKESLLIDNHYFPNINWFKNSIKFSYIIFSPIERYKKMTFRNRCVVAGSNGLVSLSVPIENGRNQKLPFKDVRIARDEPWQKQHWRTISSCYGKAPFFEYYADYFRPFFEHDYVFLFDLNMEIINTINKYIVVNQDIIINDSNSLINGCTAYQEDLPKNFQEKSSIRYAQLFEDKIGFQPNLSILDLLFMEGPNAKNILLDNDCN